MASQASLGDSALAERIVRSLIRGGRVAFTTREVQDIELVLKRLFQSVRKAGLSYVPVFGYLSLMTDNAHVLGKSSQESVVSGRDVVSARLTGYAIVPVASTVTRGTCTHPGVVAGLSPKVGRTVYGVMLKIPLSQASRLLPRLLQRELTVENDLRTSDDKASSLMYRAQVLPVELEDGRRVQCLVFTANPHSPKALLEQRVFADTDNPAGQLSPGALAWLMDAEAGDGRRARDYWKAYLSMCQHQALPVDHWIPQAVEQSMHVPSLAECARLAAQAMVDAEARARLDEHLTAWSGAALPVELHRLHQPESSAQS